MKKERAQSMLERSVDHWPGCALFSPLFRLSFSYQRITMGPVKERFGGTQIPHMMQEIPKNTQEPTPLSFPDARDSMCPTPLTDHENAWCCRFWSSQGSSVALPGRAQLQQL
eukprot:Skav235014  [mRNA]  locus=scaffold276:199828:202310:+ [translate_table: standard]